MPWGSSINFTEQNNARYGSESSVVRSILADYDLILAGRCHEAEPDALSSQWMNMQQLWPIGDLLDSEDISSTCFCDVKNAISIASL